MKLWRKSLGDLGLRVVLFEREPGGNLYREVWANGRRIKAQKSLRHKDRKRAQTDAHLILARVVSEKSGKLTLATLFDMYVESAAFGAKKDRTQREDKARLQRVMGFLGKDRDIATLTPEDVERYRQARVRGEVSGKRQRNGQGQPLLDRSPLYGVKFPREKNPKRPVETYDRYVKLMEVAGEVDWRLPLALTLAESTGRRLSSILHLRREDVDLDRIPHGWVRFDAAFDKTGHEAWVPLTDYARRVLRDHVKQLPDGTEWLFPSRLTSQPVDRSTMDHRLRKAYEQAELQSPPGGLWHAWRRKWATERKGMSLKDVAQAGGWRDETTLLKSYQQADEATLTSVVLDAPKLMAR
jgi:integrase